MVLVSTPFIGSWLSGCRSYEPGEPARVRVERAWVAAAALSDLGPDGRFRFLQPHRVHEYELGRDDAIRLATAVVRANAHVVGGTRQFLEEGHGAPIDFEQIRVCGAVLPNHSVLEAAPYPPRYIATSLGDSYLVTFCSKDGVGQVEVEMYVRSEIVLHGDGTIEYPHPFGTEHFQRPLPLDSDVDLSAEFGARLVFETTQTRIDSVPEVEGCLLVLSMCGGAQGRHWRFHLERPVSVQLTSGGERFSTQVLYTQAGFGSNDRFGLYVPHSVQPSPMWLPYLTEVGTDSTLLSLRRPIALQRVEIVR